MSPDQARKKFALAVKNDTEALAAVKLQCSVSQVRSVIAKRRNIGLRLAVAIEESYGIPATDWVERPAARKIG